jgi:hypothetical protein
LFLPNVWAAAGKATRASKVATVVETSAWRAFLMDYEERLLPVLRSDDSTTFSKV